MIGRSVEFCRNCRMLAFHQLDMDDLHLYQTCTHCNIVSLVREESSLD